MLLCCVPLNISNYQVKSEDFSKLNEFKVNEEYAAKYEKRKQFQELQHCKIEFNQQETVQNLIHGIFVFSFYSYSERQIWRRWFIQFRFHFDH